LGIITYFTYGSATAADLWTEYFSPLLKQQGIATLTGNDPNTLAQLTTFLMELVAHIPEGGVGTFGHYQIEMGFKVVQQGIVTNMWTGARDDLEAGAAQAAGDAFEEALVAGGYGAEVQAVNQFGQNLPFGGVNDLAGKMLSGGVTATGQAIGDAVQRGWNSVQSMGLSDNNPKTNIFIPYIRWVYVG
jgi:hypothetical protein